MQTFKHLQGLHFIDANFDYQGNHYHDTIAIVAYCHDFQFIWTHGKVYFILTLSFMNITRAA